MDVDEDGEVVISSLQPEVGIAIMASLTDPDGLPTGGTAVMAVGHSHNSRRPLTWEVSKSAVDHWTDHCPWRPATTVSYTPVGYSNCRHGTCNPIDEGELLRVTASSVRGRDGDKDGA